MRSARFSCLVGLVAISSLAGCTIFRNNCCETPNKDAHTRGLLQKRGKGSQQANLVHESPNQSKHVRVDDSNLPTESVPIGPVSEANAPLPFQPGAIATENIVVDGKPEAAQKPAAGPALPELVSPAAPMPFEIVTSQSAAIELIKEKPGEVKMIEIQYGPADNFKSVTGQIQVFRKSVRLRYATVDQEDIHGGVVILEGSPILSSLRDGQHVRVTGVLVPADSRADTARYRVEGIEMLD